MPRKIRQLIADLKRAGFIDRGGRGSHRNFEHPAGTRITLSGREGDDAKPYQERDLKLAIQNVAIKEVAKRRLRRTK
jgi:predicted RNA binding protein YcfA (HicA-like mRNA interferase family)